MYVYAYIYIYIYIYRERERERKICGLLLSGLLLLLLKLPPPLRFSIFVLIFMLIYRLV